MSVRRVPVSCQRYRARKAARGIPDRAGPGARPEGPPAPHRSRNPPATFLARYTRAASPAATRPRAAGAPRADARSSCDAAGAASTVPTTITVAAVVALASEGEADREGRPRVVRVRVLGIGIGAVRGVGRVRRVVRVGGVDPAAAARVPVGVRGRLDRAADVPAVGIRLRRRTRPSWTQPGGVRSKSCEGSWWFLSRLSADRSGGGPSRPDVSAWARRGSRVRALRRPASRSCRSSAKARRTSPSMRSPRRRGDRVRPPTRRRAPCGDEESPSVTAAWGPARSRASARSGNPTPSRARRRPRSRRPRSPRPRTSRETCGRSPPPGSGRASRRTRP